MSVKSNRILGAISCDCEKCQSACENKPGYFIPGEAEKVARYLNISLQTLFKKYLAIDFWEDLEKNETFFVLSPATTTIETGAIFPFCPTGTCVFYQKQRCIIHPVAPSECQLFDHTKQRKEALENHKLIARQWGGKEKYLNKLLGSELKKPLPLPGEILKMMLDQLPFIKQEDHTANLPEKQND